MRESCGKVGSFEIFQGYVRPRFAKTQLLDITQARHPVAEVLCCGGFIGNDVQLSDAGIQHMIVTGPNMGGEGFFAQKERKINNKQENPRLFAEQRLLQLWLSVGLLYPQTSVKWVYSTLFSLEWALKTTSLPESPRF